MLQAIHLTDLTHPAFQTAMLLAVGLVCIFLRHYRLATVLGVLGVSWIILCATPGFAGFLRRGLENSYPLRQAHDYPAVDAIVVLGGGDPPDFDHANDKARNTRAGFALELYREARAPLILVSGGAGEANEMVQQLEQQGPETKRHLEGKERARGMKREPQQFAVARVEKEEPAIKREQPAAIGQLRQWRCAADHSRRVDSGELPAIDLVKESGG